jgi:hypothetical protein
MMNVSTILHAAPKLHMLWNVLLIDFSWMFLSYQNIVRQNMHRKIFVLLRDQRVAMKHKTKSFYYDTYSEHPNGSTSLDHFI